MGRYFDSEFGHELYARNWCVVIPVTEAAPDLGREIAEQVEMRLVRIDFLDGRITGGGLKWLRFGHILNIVAVIATFNRRFRNRARVLLERLDE